MWYAEWNIFKSISVKSSVMQHKINVGQMFCQNGKQPQNIIYVWKKVIFLYLLYLSVMVYSLLT